MADLAAGLSWHPQTRSSSSVAVALGYLAVQRHARASDVHEGAEESDGAMEEHRAGPVEKVEQKSIESSWRARLALAERRLCEVIEEVWAPRPTERDSWEATAVANTRCVLADAEVQLDALFTRSRIR